MICECLIVFDKTSIQGAVGKAIIYTIRDSSPVKQIPEHQQRHGPRRVEDGRDYR